MKSTTVWEGEYMLMFPNAEHENFVLALSATPQQKASGKALNLLFVGEAVHITISPQRNQEIQLCLQGFSTEPLEIDLVGALGYIRMPHIKIKLNFTPQGEIKEVVCALRDFTAKRWKNLTDVQIEKMIPIK